MSTQEHDLLTALICLRVRVDAGEIPRYGICNGAEEELTSLYTQRAGGDYDDDEWDDFQSTAEDVVEELLPDIFEKWWGFSGNRGYPVPGPGGVTGSAAFGDVCRRRAHIEFWTGDYGRSRRELLDFCIEYLDEITS